MTFHWPIFYNASGNAYADQYGITDNPERNAFIHAYASASLKADLLALFDNEQATSIAYALGFVIEFAEPSSRPYADNFGVYNKDFLNNGIGASYHPDLGVSPQEFIKAYYDVGSLVISEDPAQQPGVAPYTPLDLLSDLRTAIAFLDEAGQQAANAAIDFFSAMLGGEGGVGGDEGNGLISDPLNGGEGAGGAGDGGAVGGGPNNGLGGVG